MMYLQRITMHEVFPHWELTIFVCVERISICTTNNLELKVNCVQPSFDVRGV